MENLSELEKVDRQIRDLQIRYETIRIKMDALEREIAHLHLIEISVIENLELLRKHSMIAVASEYKKAKDTLAQARNKLVFLRIDRENHKKALANAEKVINQLKEIYTRLLDFAKNNVVYVDFKKKNGQK